GIRDLIVTGVQTCALPISLRTTFAVKDEEPLQLIHPELKIKINVTELDHVAGEERENRLQALASEVSVKSFDLSRLPLIRVSLRSEERRVGKECRRGAGGE